jgi:hypothetical protein
MRQLSKSPKKEKEKKKEKKGSGHFPAVAGMCQRWRARPLQEHNNESTPHCCRYVPPLSQIIHSQARSEALHCCKELVWRTIYLQLDTTPEAASASGGLARESRLGLVPTPTQKYYLCDEMT